jgi:hypothetical protein
MMKRYVFSIFGSNASGKSTAVRQMISAAVAKEKSYIIGDRKVEAMESSDGRTTFIGNYKSSIDGVDRWIKSQQELFELAKKVFESRSEILIFESFIFGKSYKFNLAMQEYGKIIGFDYYPVLFYAGQRTIENRLKERNDRAFSAEKVNSAREASIRCFKRLKGVMGTQCLDTGKTPREGMGALLDGIIEEVTHENSL